MITRTARLRSAEDASRVERRLRAHRQIMARSRERRRRGAMVALVEIDESVIDMLVRKDWLHDDATDAREIAAAIGRLLQALAAGRDAAPQLEPPRTKMRA
jgi:hypothetical protein